MRQPWQHGWLLPAFEFDGAGPRFMQDFALPDGASDSFGISALFIETPGENALRKNKDHFIKRGGITALCPCCAATALLTLQINAPAGGAGHRTGLRGGGPLTTLLLCSPAMSLWHDLAQRAGTARLSGALRAAGAQRCCIPFSLAGAHGENPACHRERRNPAHTSSPRPCVLGHAAPDQARF